MNQRAIAYTRVSSQRQVDEGNSLSVQKKHILEYAEKNGFESMKFFVEQGESAKNANRTQPKAMLEYLYKNHSKIDALIIYKVDRLARKMFDKYDKDELDIKSELLELRTHNDDAEELLELRFDKLTNLKQTLEDIKEPEVRFRFQKWLFPVGLTYDGEKFGTTQMSLIYRLKKEHPFGYS